MSDATKWYRPSRTAGSFIHIWIWHKSNVFKKCFCFIFTSSNLINACMQRVWYIFSFHYQPLPVCQHFLSFFVFAKMTLTLVYNITSAWSRSFWYLVRNALYFAQSFSVVVHLYEDLWYKMFQRLSVYDSFFNKFPLLVKAYQQMCFSDQYFEYFNHLKFIMSDNNISYSFYCHIS